MTDYTVILTRDVTVSAVVAIHDAANEQEAQERALDASNEFPYELDDIVNAETYVTGTTERRR